MSAWAFSSAQTPPRGRFFFLGKFCIAAGMFALCAAWLAANHYPPWTSFHGELAAFAALVLVCLAQLCDRPLADWRPPALAATCASVLLTAQWWAGQIPYGGDALLSGIYLVGACWAWWAGASAWRCSSNRQTADRPFTLVTSAFVLAAIASVHVGLLQWLRMETHLGIFAADRGPDMRVFANLAQPNHLATLCAMAAMMAIWVFRSGQIRWPHLVVILSYLAAGVTMSESRSGLLGAAMSGAFCIALASKAGMHRGSGIFRPVLVWWLLLLLGALLWPAINEALYLQPARVAQLAKDGARTTMWHQSLAAIVASPWWGYGWRQTMFAQKLAALQVPGWLATDYAHNIVLDLALWVGVPASLVLLALAARWAFRALNRIDSERQLFLAASVIPFIIHSFVEFPFAYAYFLLPVAWVLGHLSANQCHPRTAQPGSNGARHWLMAALALYSGLGVLLVREYLDIEEDYRVMRFELRKIGRTPDGYERPQVHVLTQLDALLKTGRVAPHPGMSTEELAAMRMASERNGWATLDLAYAAALGLNGRPDEAQLRLKQLEAVYGPESGQQSRLLFRQLQSQYPTLSSIRFN